MTVGARLHKDLRQRYMLTRAVIIFAVPNSERQIFPYRMLRRKESWCANDAVAHMW